MKSSDSLISTVKEAPNDAQIISHQLMIRAGLISKLASGIYSYLPLGLKVVQKVEKIIREEMNKSKALELLMPLHSLQKYGKNQKDGKSMAQSFFVLRIGMIEIFAWALHMKKLLPILLSNILEVTSSCQ